MLLGHFAAGFAARAAATMTSTGVLLGAALLLSGCGRPDESGGSVGSRPDGDTVPGVPAGADGEVPPEAGEERQPPDPELARLVADWRTRIPPAVLLREGACPFECCTYREWTALEEIPVQARERGRQAPTFTIPAGARFMADSGNVHITGIGLVVAADTIQSAYGEPRLLPGDTAVVLDYLGEGYWRLWHRQEVVEVEGFWGAEHPSPRGSLLGRYRSEWWVHVRYDGREGWFQVAPGTSFRGADACG